jgi:hypothetical protein
VSARVPISFLPGGEIARRALWHTPNSRDEVRKLVKYLDIENLRQPHSRDDDAPDEPPWS